MPPTGKSLKNRLMNYKYYYTYGLFDVVRRHEKNILTRISPEDLHTVAIEDARQCDSLILVSSDYPITTDRTEALVSLDEKNLIAGEAVQPLAELIRASEAACGEKILFTSVYRTLAFQESIYGVNPFAGRERASFRPFGGHQGGGLRTAPLYHVENREMDGEKRASLRIHHPLSVVGGKAYRCRL